MPNRPPNALMLILAYWAVLSLTAAAPLVQARGLDPVKPPPLSQLLEQADRGDVVAFDELRRCIRDGDIDGSKLRRVIAAALERQADRTRPWEPAWGDLIELAQQVDRLPKEEWQRYLQQAVRVDLIARPQIAADGWLVPGSRIEARFGSLSSCSIAIQFTDLVLGDRVVDSPFFVQGGVADGRFSYGPRPHRPVAPHDLGLVTFPVGMLRFAQALSVVVETEDELREILHRDERVLEAMVQVLPAGTPTAEFIEPDDATEAEIHRHLRIKKQPEVERLWPWAEDRLLLIRGELRPLPVNVAFRIEVYLDGDERPAIFGKLVHQQGQPTFTFEVSGEVGNRNPRELIVRFVPSLDLAEQTLFMTQVWSRPIELGPLKVQQAE